MVEAALLYFLYVASFSSCVRFGGNAGSAEASKVGARIENVSDRPEVMDVPLEIAEVPDLAVAIELMDSLDG